MIIESTTFNCHLQVAQYQPFNQYDRKKNKNRRIRGQVHFKPVPVIHSCFFTHTLWLPLPRDVIGASGSPQISFRSSEA